MKKLLAILTLSLSIGLSSSAQTNGLNGGTVWFAISRITSSNGTVIISPTNGQGAVVDLSALGGGGSLGPGAAGTNIYVSSSVVGTNTNYVLNTTATIIIPGSFFALQGLIEGSNLLAVANVAWLSNAIGNGFGVFGLPLSGITPYTQASGLLMAQNNQVIISTNAYGLAVDHGKAQMSNGLVTIYSPLAYETNTIGAFYHSTDHPFTHSILDYRNVTNGVSFDVISGNTIDTNFVDWWIFSGGKIQTNTTSTPTLDYYTITVTPGVNGTMSPVGTASYLVGSSLTITASPSVGYIANVWSVDSTPVQTNGNTYTLQNIQGGHTVVCTFASQTYTLTYSVVGGIGGTLSVPGGSAGSVTVSAGTNIVFTASPSNTFSINQWIV